MNKHVSEIKIIFLFFFNFSYYLQNYTLKAKIEAAGLRAQIKIDTQVFS